MPYGSGPSVVHRNGCDYWRTWFFEECEENQLFGITEKHLGLVKLRGVGITPYHVGTRIFLDDAPYFSRGTKTHHRICGPYEIVAMNNNLPADAKPEHTVGNEVIIYKEAHPEKAPWLNRNNVVRDIDGIKVKFNQIAKKYHFFPFRFGIIRAHNFKIELVEHNLHGCWLC